MFTHVGVIKVVWRDAKFVLPELQSHDVISFTISDMTWRPPKMDVTTMTWRDVSFWIQYVDVFLALIWRPYRSNVNVTLCSCVLNVWMRYLWRSKATVAGKMSRKARNREIETSVFWLSVDRATRHLQYDKKLPHTTPHRIVQMYPHRPNVSTRRTIRRLQTNKCTSKYIQRHRRGTSEVPATSHADPHLSQCRQHTINSCQSERDFSSLAIILGKLRCKARNLLIMVCPFRRAGIMLCVVGLELWYRGLLFFCTVELWPRRYNARLDDTSKYFKAR